MGTQRSLTIRRVRGGSFVSSCREWTLMDSASQCDACLFYRSTPDWEHLLSPGRENRGPKALSPQKKCSFNNNNPHIELMSIGKSTEPWWCRCKPFSLKTATAFGCLVKSGDATRHCYQLISTGCTTHGVRGPLKLGLDDGTAPIGIRYKSRNLCQSLETPLVCTRQCQHVHLAPTVCVGACQLLCRRGDTRTADGAHSGTN